MESWCARPGAALFTALALLLAGCGEQSGQTASAQSSRPPPEVGVVKLQTQRVVLSAEFPGRTTAYQIAEVRPQVTGILKKRLFKQGEQVEAGDVLYQIDAAKYRAAYERAESEVEVAKAELRQAKRQWKRISTLYERDTISESQRDEALSALESARARVASAEAELQTARIRLNDTEVKSPITGHTGPTRYTVGALVTENQTEPLSRVVRLDPIYVDIQVPVNKLRRIRRAQQTVADGASERSNAEAAVLLDNGDVYDHRGQADVADVTVNPNTSSVTLRAEFPNPDEDLLPGMYVRVRVVEEVRETAILAPQQGVTRNPRGEATALVVTTEDTVAKRTIKTGRAIGSFWLIEEGLEAGDRLIVSGLQSVQPGAKVTAVPADIPNKPDRAEDLTRAAPGGSDQTGRASLTE